MRSDEYVLTRYEGQVTDGRSVSPVVECLLQPPGPHLVWWLVVHRDSDTVIGGLRLNRHSGVTGRDVFGDSAVIDGVSVDPGHLRRGVATALMRAVEAWLVDRPYLPRVISLGVEVDNAPAVALYRRCGYVVRERDGEPVVITGGNGPPCHVMYRHIAAPQGRSGDV